MLYFSTGQQKLQLKNEKKMIMYRNMEYKKNIKKLQHKEKRHIERQ
jgi:hypothetical protein